MIEITNYNQKGIKSSEIKLPEELFSLPWNNELIHQVVVSMMKNKRAGTAKTKTRAEVRGGGKKPWKQKGTGRARHGSIRSPLWVGGGVTFGPTTEKKYFANINKKMKTKAFFTVLSEKVRRGEVSFMESVSLEAPSTKTAVNLLKKICGENIDNKKNTCVVVLPESNSNFLRSISNVFGVKTIDLSSFNTMDAVNSRKVLFVDAEKTLELLKERGTTILNSKVKK